jgi:hypothetical protein
MPARIAARKYVKPLNGLLESLPEEAGELYRTYISSSNGYAAAGNGSTTRTSTGYAIPAESIADGGSSASAGASQSWFLTGQAKVR